MPETMDGLLTDREKEVLGLVGRGLTNSEIAAELFTSTSTVKVCLHQACAKLGARNRAQAVISAIKRGQIDVQEFYSIDELADLVVSLGPDAARKITAILKSKLHRAEPSLSLE